MVAITRMLFHFHSVLILFGIYNVLAQENKGTTKSPVFGGPSADNDPHFIVQLQGASYPVCFDVTGHNGEIYKLISDPDKEFFVNGQIFGANVTKRGHVEHRTYFGGITLKKKSLKVVITTSKIKVLGRKGRRSLKFPWKKNQRPRDISSGVRLSVKRQNNVTVYIGDDVTLSVVKHRHRKMGLKFLGVYLVKGQGLSKNVAGLIGEFQYKKVSETLSRDRRHATLRVLTTAGEKSVRVALGSRLNMAHKVHVTCWRVPHRHSGVLNFAHDKYLVPEMSGSPNNKWKESYFMAF